MLVHSAIFYLFAALAILSGLGVVFSRNPVRAVLWLILAFLASAGLFVLQGAEFVAMLLVIVYVGAVAVLFLFVVMMLDVDFATLKAGMVRYIPFGLLVAALVLTVITWRVADWTGVTDADLPVQYPAPDPDTTENTVALGQLIYTEYILLFQMAGVILLIAMIGAIVLTHRRKRGVKRQDIVAQIYRDPAESVELKDIPPGRGLR